MRSIAILSTVLLCALCAQKVHGQTKTLGQGVAAAAQQILSNDTCKSWPPILVKPKDQTKSPDKLTPKQQEALQKAQDAFAAWLDKKLQISTDQGVISYSDSFLRLFDTPKANDDITSFPKGDVSDLLGLSQVPDAEALSIWGTTQVAIKYDCQSLGNAYAKANSGLVLPLYSINGGVTLTSSAQNDQTVDFLITTAQSPFDIMYSDKSADKFRRLFASLMAAEWTAGHATNLHYLKKATLLSVETLSSSNDATSMLASATLGTNFPFLTASADVKSQITKDLESSAHTFQTFIYTDPTSVAVDSFPSLHDLLHSVTRNMTGLQTSANPVIPGKEQQAFAQIEGWPSNLCLKNAWTATAKNTLYGTPVLDFKPLPANPSGYPVCQITATFTLSNSDATATTLATNQSLMSDPQLSMTDRSYNTVSIDLPLDKPLQLSGKPQLTALPMPVNWQKLPATSPTDLAWILKGAVTLPDATAVTGYSIDPGSFKCTVSPRGTAYPMQATFAPAIISADTLASPKYDLTTTDTSLELVLSVSPQQVSPSYDPDTLLNLKSCNLSGTLFVLTSANGTSQKTSFTFTSPNPINFPNQLPGTFVSAIVCDAKKNASGNYLLASTLGNGMTCTLVGTGLQTATTVSLRSKSNPGPLFGNLSSAVANGGTTATILFDPPSLKTLTETAYTLMMTDNTANHTVSSLATDLNVVPLPAATTTPAAMSVAAAQAGFSFTLQGTNLDQIVQLRLKPQSGTLVAATGSTVATASSLAATFPAGALPAGTYEIFAVVDTMARVEFDLGKTIGVAN